MVMAYHTNVEALGGMEALTPERQFARSLRSALDGHLPYVAQAQACQRFIDKKVSLESLEARMIDALSMDIPDSTSKCNAGTSEEDFGRR